MRTTSCVRSLTIREPPFQPSGMSCQSERGMLHEVTCNLQVDTFISGAEALHSDAWPGATTSTARWRTPSTSSASAGRCSSSASSSRTTSSATRISTRDSPGCGTNILAARLKTLESGRRRPPQAARPAGSLVGLRADGVRRGASARCCTCSRTGARDRSVRRRRSGDLEPGWLSGALRIALPLERRAGPDRVPDRRRRRLGVDGREIVEGAGRRRPRR